MEEKQILKAVGDTVTQDSITFEIDVVPISWFHSFLQRIKLKPKKKEFEIKPLTLNQLQQVSKLMLPIEFLEITATGVLNLMINHSRTCAEIIAISVTESRQKPKKSLINLFFNSLSKDDMTLALSIVLQQMNYMDFLNTIASMRSLNLMNMNTKQNVRAQVAETKEESPTVPGILSAAS
jgi:hypothetical protein